jgi:hypothetical protein
MSHDLVRPFVMTGGRTRTERRDLRLETMLRTIADAPPGTRPSEQEAMLRLCRDPQSIAEVASKLDLVAGVTAILAGDLVADGLLEVHHTDPVDIELDALTRMIERVRAI